MSRNSNGSEEETRRAGVRVRVGCHMSVSDGYAKMLHRAQEMSADVVQYFSKNPKSYRVRIFDPDVLRAEREKVAELDIITVAHTPYVTNLATSDSRLRETTIASIVNDLEIAEAYGSPYVIVHCGKHVGAGVEKGMELMVSAIDEVMTRYQGPVVLLLENTAGQGTELGRTPGELLALRNALADAERVAFCFDSCHSFAGGLWRPEDWDKVVGELEEGGFADLVRVLHLNDCKMPYNSRRDRHELLGEGEIGAAGLQLFLQAEIFAGVPVIIESPVEEEADYADEIAKARQWLAGRS
ncbi:MAG TPA: deoxyribonuclease IV [Firmicutes bacterium]|nr:deoxyribonuclease IV [Bacillota bacterium]